MQTALPLDLTDVRKRMVDSQIRPNKVSDPRILAAMLVLPRERFLPAQLAARAYGDDDVSLDGVAAGSGRVLMAPLSIARLVQLAAPMAGDRALVVGAGTGYGAALLTACGAKVVALEEDRRLLAMARRTLSAAVSLIEGSLAAGWAAQAPYDLILIEGAVTEVPPALAGQLRPDTGRLVTVRAGRGQTGGGQIGQALLAESAQGQLRCRELFDCALPALPSLRRTHGFVF